MGEKAKNGREVRGAKWVGEERGEKWREVITRVIWMGEGVECK